jgi:hypothetical protein
MAATPRYGTMILVGMRTGKTYIKDIYFPDVLAGQINWDGGAGASATSPTDWTAPEPCILTDMSVVTGMVDTTKLQILRNGIPSGDFLRYSIHETTLALRPRLRIGFNAGTRIAGLMR